MKRNSTNTMTHPKTLTSILFASAFLNLAAAPAWNAPPAASTKANPFAGNKSAIAKGREIFQTSCVVCHGNSGKGDGPAGAALKPPPADLGGQKVAAQSDGALLWKIAHGRAPMPAFSEAFKKDDLWKVVSYIRTMSPGGAPVAATGDEQEVTQQAVPQSGGNLVGSDGISPAPGAGTLGEADALGGMGGLIPGRTSSLLTGYASASFQSLQGQDSTFNAKLVPVFLWKQGDNLLFEGELELGLEDGETEANLEYSQILWVANDNLTIGVGKFLNPMNYYAERVHPDWINKLPSAPLPFGHDGSIIAPTQLGIQARGGIPIGNARFSYAVYLSNGPSIVIELEEEEHEEEEGEDEHEEAAAIDEHGDEEGGHGPANGALDFSNFRDRNNNLAVGGRVAILLSNGLEIGYGLEVAEVDPSDSSISGIGALTQAIDLNYVLNSDSIKGVLEARVQYVWVDIDNPSIEPLDFENKSSGGYAQLAYRPIRCENEFLKNLEYVGRFDWLELPDDQPKQERVTVGLNYWLNQSTVIKAGFEFGSKGDEDYTGFRAQAAIGF